MNIGKKFENNFKKSVPEDMFLYRLRDSSGTWSNGDKTRFTPSNICDYILFDGDYLYLFELKSTKGKSLPFTNIKEHQINDLMRANEYSNIFSLLVIEFSDIEEYYCLKIDDFKTFYDSANRKSLPIEFCREKGIKIGYTRLRTNVKLNIKQMIDRIIEEFL